MIKKLCLILTLTAVTFLMVPQSTLVAAGARDQVLGGVNSGAGGTTNGGTTLDDTIQKVINLLSVAVGIAAIIMLIVGGLKYITSGGNPEKTKSAKNTVIYAVVGLAVVGLSQTIARFALTESTTGQTSKTGGP